MHMQYVHALASATVHISEVAFTALSATPLDGAAPILLFAAVC